MDYPLLQECLSGRWLVGRPFRFGMGSVVLGLIGLLGLLLRSRSIGSEGKVFMEARFPFSL